MNAGLIDHLLVHYLVSSVKFDNVNIASAWEGSLACWNKLYLIMKFRIFFLDRKREEFNRSDIKFIYLENTYQTNELFCSSRFHS